MGIPFRKIVYLSPHPKIAIEKSLIFMDEIHIRPINKVIKPYFKGPFSIPWGKKITAIILNKVN